MWPLKTLKFNFAVLPKATLHPILKRVCWSFNIALLGRRPPRSLRPGEFELNSRQKNLEDSLLSYTWALTEVKGDWQWHTALFKMWTHYWKCGTICFRCEAARIPK